MFDITNANELIAGSNKMAFVKPRLRQIGPFVFKMKRIKDIVSISGDTLFYTERKLYHYLPELSCCSINTTVTIPNIPLVSLVERASSVNVPLVSRLLPRLVNRAVQSLREQMFVKKQVRELLFDGYEVELLKMVALFSSLVGGAPTSNRFALFMSRNDTWRPEVDGVWAINTGASDKTKFGQVSSWNAHTTLPFWPAAQCNKINGSDGTLFPPPIKNTEPLYIFNPDLCRAVSMDFAGKSSVRSIDSFRFVLSPRNFAPSYFSASRSGGNGGVAAASGLVASRARGVATAITNAAAARQERRRLARQMADGEPSNEDLVIANLEPNSGSTTIVGAGPATPINSQQQREQRMHVELTKQRLAANELQKQSQRIAAIAANNQPLNSGTSASSSSSFTGRATGNTRATQQQHLRQPNPLSCFCDRKNIDINGINVCEFDGLIDMSKCTKNAHVIFGSSPHFNKADERLLNQVDGLMPNASLHTTYLDIEPVSIFHHSIYLISLFVCLKFLLANDWQLVSYCCVTIKIVE